MNGSERFRHGEPLLYRPASRRRFLLGSAEAIEAAAIGAAVLTVIGGIAYVWVTSEGESQQRYGEVVGDEVKYLEVHTYDVPPVLRKDLSLKDKAEIGQLKLGTEVEVLEVLGPVYPTGQLDLIVEVETNGQKEEYGLWYKLLRPVEVYKNNGKAEVRFGFIAGNFLGPSKESELPAAK